MLGFSYAYRMCPVHDQNSPFEASILSFFCGYLTRMSSSFCFILSFFHGYLMLVSSSSLWFMLSLLWLPHSSVI